MEYKELINERYSIRKFSSKKVEDEKIDAIINAGMIAPTAVNFQPQRMLILKSDENLAKLKECTPFHFHAPVAILVCYDNTKSWKRSFDGKDSGDIDASIAASQMMLEVTNLGLGTTWVGHFNPAKIIEAYNLPENIIPVALFPIGYPSENSEPNPLHFKTIEKEKMVFSDSFDGVNDSNE